ncbi:DUF3576 domain-containing protein [Amylibacter sp.]|jgi:hypothetical protein|nr:DUF3576 domain-containing protein [Amylibacter sp.]MDC1488766.1 DUF3576 domain-containing protein [Amylibacter sp.]|tara:strand:- start:256 stop:774 length:519 start_codon:yes stop_codon:yes gene_type:complete
MKKLSQNLSICFLLCLAVNACSENDSKDIESNKSVESSEKKNKKKLLNFTPPKQKIEEQNGIKLSDLLNIGGDEIGSVNKYLWQASLETLSFLPIKTADPFSGIISFDKGRAPGSSQVYDATIYISDVALDARSLNVSVRNSNGSVSYGAEREIENAILSRARQLRINTLNK